ncbi:hypothetical protein [Nostoc sp.]|uniref:hypothetical protein n=1 Tax=Nostoc sp. TaxID=1180 RepID=UPI002FF4E9C9
MSIDSQAFKFDFFTISLRSLVIRQLVANSLKQRIFVDTHDSPFGQCVSPTIN